MGGHHVFSVQLKCRTLRKGVPGIIISPSSITVAAFGALCWLYAGFYFILTAYTQVWRVRPLHLCPLLGIRLHAGPSSSALLSPPLPLRSKLLFELITLFQNNSTSMPHIFIRSPTQNFLIPLLSHFPSHMSRKFTL